MNEVHPLQLESGTTYYLEYQIKTVKTEEFKPKDPNYSYKLRGRFVKYNDLRHYTTALFKDVESVNNKPPHQNLGVINSSLEFAVFPHEFAAYQFKPIYKIYKPIKRIREVNLQELIKGKTYYLEYLLSKLQTKVPNYSYEVTGKFLEYKNSHDYKYALFEDVKNVDDKQTLYKGIKVDDYGKLKFAVAPHEFAADRFEPTYKIYQPIENLREEVARRMINSQYSLSEGNPSTYEDTPVKNSVGDDLAKEISKYLGLGGRRHRKSRKTRKSRKSRKTKSRRRR